MAITQLHPQTATGRRYGNFGGRSPGLLTVSGIAAAVWGSMLAPPYTAGDLLLIIAAISAGKTTIINLGGGTAQLIFRSINDTHDTVTAEMTGSERTDVTLDP